VPLGIDLDEIAGKPGDLRREIGAGENEIVVGSVGRLCEVKNHKLLLEAAAEVLRDRDPGSPPIRFVIVGDGELRGQLEEQARRLGIEESVIFAGFREDAAAIYWDLDLVVLTSTNEGTPLTLLEAMATGRPVVATEVGGVVDILGERLNGAGRISIWEHGISARSSDADGVAEAIDYLVARPGARAEMGSRGRLYVRARLSRRRLIRDIEALYHELLDPGAAALEIAAAPIRTE